MRKLWRLLEFTPTHATVCKQVCLLAMTGRANGVDCSCKQHHRDRFDPLVVHCPSEFLHRHPYACPYSSAPWSALNMERAR